MQPTKHCPNWGLMVGALGVVYGDIGTSPLYALQQCFNGQHGVAPNRESIFGIVSLVCWTLMSLVSVKYLLFVMRAHNQGEGGVLALLSLAVSDTTRPGRRVLGLTLVGLFGASLLLGDGMITPAITVISAFEGLQVASKAFAPWVLPLSVSVLVALFAVQRFGTSRVGAWFGPITLVWFATLAALGLRGIMAAPEILGAISPHHALLFLVDHWRSSILVLGAVFLVVTGAEALYADMGHFGANPIRQAWFLVVLPGLILNYLGQGALLLRQPEAADNPFFRLAPGWGVYPLVALSTMAGVIASQALISGTYSLAMQAVQMGYLPRLKITHTSHAQRGQIYMPQVNFTLMIACVGLVLSFASSTRLAAAYGVAVSLTMAITTALFVVAARRLWRWGVPQLVLFATVFLGLELSFVGANIVKFMHGGWFPLVVGVGLFAMMTSWRRGRAILRERLSQSYLPLDQFLDQLGRSSRPRVPGTAVFLSGNPEGTPIALLHNLKHNKVLHEQVVLLNLRTLDRPIVALEDRLSVEPLKEGVWRIVGRYGFMESPHVPDLLRLAETRGLRLAPMETTFFLSRETLIPTRGPGLAYWRKRLFAAMSRNAQSAAAYFNLPPNRVVELGMQVEV